ncbi:hypothetical protein DFH28DRAFT_931556 [Melampsora americana]|nr:hypothetical protein DFH28DRAFT_931556 [Melampsora americana]
MPSSNNGTQSAQASPTISTTSTKCEWTGDQESKMIDLLTKVHESNKSNKACQTVLRHSGLKKRGTGWNEKTKMVELQPAIRDEMTSVKTGVNQRLGWLRRNLFPLFDAVGLLVDPGMAKGTVQQAHKSAAQAGEEFIEGIDSISDKLITHMSKETSALASGSSAQSYDFLTSATQGLQKLGSSDAELYKAKE